MKSKYWYCTYFVGSSKFWFEVMNISTGCTNETVAEGHCFGLSICGWCYDYGEARIVSKEYEKFNSFCLSLVHFLKFTLEVSCNNYVFILRSGMSYNPLYYQEHLKIIKIANKTTKPI
uniref:Uncharacterized protein n=1 Tax=Heterorhabditis bacteriophora TaxID=37862 RepID=A0A1I7X2X8_HETBA